MTDQLGRLTDLPAVVHVAEGSVTAVVDEATHRVQAADTLAVPMHAGVLANASGVAPACLFVVDDAPLQRKLGINEVLSSAVR